MKKHLLPSFIILTLLLACQKKEASTETVITEDTTVFRLDFDAMSTMLMRRINIEPGEKILIVASPGRFDAMIPLLKEKIQTSRGEYLGTISVDSANWPQEWRTTFVDGTANMSVDAMAEYFK